MVNISIKNRSIKNVSIKNVSVKKSPIRKNKTIKNVSIKKSPIRKNKTLKTKKTKGQVQRIVHQIWFGSKVPAWRQYLFDANKEICKKNGYAYHLWLEADRVGPIGKKNFPSTYGYQASALEYGNSRWAQVADLARIEIIYLHGGIYLDSLFEISNLFLQKMDEISEKGYQFIGANEDPCQLECVGYNNTNYLTNSFFAAKKGSIILERLLDDDLHSEIDLASEYVNRTTGPYYLRKGISNPSAEKVYLFDTDQIYPFNVNASQYREVHPNTCLSKTLIKNSVQVPLKDKQGKPINIYLRKKCLEKMQKDFMKKHTVKQIKDEFLKEKGPLVIYHSGLGGTWSF